MGSIFVLTFFSLYLKINIDKASQKVTKDPKHVEAARKCRENYMSKLKESILNDAKKDSRDTSNASNEATGATNTANTTATTPANNTTNTAISDTYIQDLGIPAVLAIRVCVFFAYNTSQAANKKQVQQQAP